MVLNTVLLNSSTAGDLPSGHNPKNCTPLLRDDLILTHLVAKGVPYAVTVATLVLMIVIDREWE
jgi:hypothetical protein